jgi:hypothetical protein
MAEGEPPIGGNLAEADGAREQRRSGEDEQQEEDGERA